MVTFENLQLAEKNNILYLIVSRESKLNALNQQTVEELREAMQGVYDDKNIKGVIISGQGAKAFVAGADISEIAGLTEWTGRKYAETGQEVFRMIENCPKPVIAAVNGYALGGGCELALACHIRVASSNAKFGQPEVNLGIIPGFGGTQRLTHVIGKSKGLEMMLTGEPIGAAEALQLGLVNYVVEFDQLFPKCEEILKKIFTKAPLAVGMVIECVNAAYNPQENGFQTEANSFTNCCKTDDFKEGTSAFLEKRKATFIGE